MTQRLRYAWAMYLTAIAIVIFIYLFFSISTSQAKVRDVVWLLHLFTTIFGNTPVCFVEFWVGREDQYHFHIRKVKLNQEPVILYLAVG